MEGIQDAGQARNFLEAVNDNFWAQNVGEWTHLRETDHPSRLDLVFTKTPTEIEDISIPTTIRIKETCSPVFQFTSSQNQR